MVLGRSSSDGESLQCKERCIYIAATDGQSRWPSSFVYGFSSNASCRRRLGFCGIPKQNSTYSENDRDEARSCFIIFLIYIHHLNWAPWIGYISAQGERRQYIRAKLITQGLTVLEPPVENLNVIVFPYAAHFSQLSHAP
jgi:hypothetical protein